MGENNQCSLVARPSYRKNKKGRHATRPPVVERTALVLGSLIRSHFDDWRVHRFTRCYFLRAVLQLLTVLLDVQRLLRHPGIHGGLRHPRRQSA